MKNKTSWTESAAVTGAWQKMPESLTPSEGVRISQPYYNLVSPLTAPMADLKVDLRDSEIWHQLAE